MPFSGKIAEAYVDIKTNTKGYERGVSGVKSSLFSLGKLATGIGAGLIIGNAAIKGIKSITNAFMAEEDALAKLNGVLKSTGNASGFSSKEMAEFAQEIQRTTTFSNDAIINVQALMATFTNIKGDNFREATKMAAEMSAVFGQDLKSSAIQLGKALNDPIAGLGALSRVGVSFNDQQKEMVKNLVKTGQVTEAQTLILKAMKEQGLEGAAAAMRNTLGGSLKGLANDLQDMGKEVIRAFNFDQAGGAINLLSSKIQVATKWINELVKTEGFQIFLAFIKSWGKSLWLQMKTPWVLAYALLQDFWEAIKAYVWNPLKNLIPLLGLFSDSIAASFASASEAFDMLPDGIKHTKEALKGLADEAEGIASALSDPLNNAGKAINEVNKKIVNGQTDNQEAIKKTSKAFKGLSEDMRSQMQQEVLGNTTINGVSDIGKNVDLTKTTSATPSIGGTRSSELLQQLVDTTVQIRDFMIRESNLMFTGIS